MGLKSEKTYRMIATISAATMLSLVLPLASSAGYMTYRLDTLRNESRDKTEAKVNDGEMSFQEYLTEEKKIEGDNYLIENYCNEEEQKKVNGHKIGLIATSRVVGAAALSGIGAAMISAGLTVKEMNKLTREKKENEMEMN